MDKKDIQKPDEQAGYLLMQVSLLKQRKVNAKLKKLDITYIQFIILAGILELGLDYKWVTQQTIVTERRLDKAMVSNVVKTLLEKKLIVRGQHPSDSRAWVLKLTETGEKAVVQAKEIVKKIDDIFFSNIDKEILRTTLKELLINNNTENGEE